MQESIEIKALHYETGKSVVIGICNGIIETVTEKPYLRMDKDLYVAPGLIDNQVNGYKGIDFSGSDLDTETMRNAVDAINSDGVTSFMPTVITAPHEELIRIFRRLSSTLKDSFIRDSVIGFHLEGPYISTEPGFYGCHPSEFIRNPSWEEFEFYQEAAEGNIVQVTVSPESEGCIEFIDKCVSNDIMVAIGHSNASASQINMATEHGARLSTHLGNGCANLIDRHNNPIWPQLANELLIPTIIADGHHLLPEEIKVFLKVKGPENIILTSDVTHLIGLAPGRYKFLGSDIIMTQEGLIKNPALNCLAGASFPLRTGVGNVVRFTGCTFGQAVNMATVNCSRVYRLDDRGSIEPGKRADLIIYEIIDNNIKIRQVLIKGVAVGSH